MGFVSEEINQIAHYPSDDPQLVSLKRAKKQLVNFLKYWDQTNKYEPHVNDGLGYEELFKIIKKERIYFDNQVVQRVD